MPKQQRFKTKYPGVYYIEGTGADGKTERIFYIVYRKDGKLIEERAGRQFRDDMTAARANTKRTDRLNGKEGTNKEQRDAEESKKAAEDSKWTIAKLWDLYCQTFSDNKVIEHESRKFDMYLRNEFGGKEPAQLLALDVDRLRIRLQKQGKHTTAARILELLRRTVNFGVKRGLVSPLSFKIEVPKLNNEVTEDLTDAQVQALLEALDADPDQRAANIMRLALFSGMRRGEILKLRWEDLDFERGFIKLDDPKGGRNQTIPMNDLARSVFISIDPQEGNPYVFPGKIPGTHLTECRMSLKRIRKAAGLPDDFRPLHGLRHAFASTLASSGQVDLYTLQRLMTHKSPLMTQRYAHLRDDALRRASNLAGEIIQQTAAKDAKILQLSQNEKSPRGYNETAKN